METMIVDQEYEIALQVKLKRISRMLTPQEIATLTGVSQEDLEAFQHGKPVKPAVMRKILNAFIFKDTVNQYITSRFFNRQE